MFNIFAAPGDVFAEVKEAKPSTANWLVPVLLFVVVGIISVFIVFSQEAIVQQIREQQNKAIEDQVAAGKMPRAQADQAEAMMEKFAGATVMKITGSFFVVVLAFVRVFWWAFVLWLLAKWFLNADIPYQKGMEVAGLAMMISILGSLVTTLLSVMMGKALTGVNPTLLLANDNPTSLLHMCLGALDVFDLWIAFVLATGLTRLTAAPCSKAFSVTFGYWLAMDCLLVFGGWTLAHLSTGFK